ncbi:MAG: hypothetical protein JNJ54_32080 [Myxococcaceae bacterium]|nr:hypothetical protein [Myxococcaceae bacterium]
MSDDDEAMDESTTAWQPDPLEDAWLDQELSQVQKLAQQRLETDALDAAAHAWLGLARCAQGDRREGFAGLTRAFELFRKKEAASSNEDEKAELAWELHAIGNRLLEALQEEPEAAVEAARFVVETLKLEHPMSLRWLAEDLAPKDPVKAAGLLKRALAVEPTDPETHYLAARVMARMGKKPQVLGELSKAIEYAEGTIAVRALARVEPDFDGFRDDEQFKQLTDLLPTSEPLRAVYTALDEGRFVEVLSLAEAATPKVKNALDLLYPCREALEQLIDGGDDARVAELEALQATIEDHEGRDEESPTYARFCGDA